MIYALTWIVLIVIVLTAFMLLHCESIAKMERRIVEAERQIKTINSNMAYTHIDGRGFREYLIENDPYIRAEDFIKRKYLNAEEIVMRFDELYTNLGLERMETTAIPSTTLLCKKDKTPTPNTKDKKRKC